MKKRFFLLTILLSLTLCSSCGAPARSLLWFTEDLAYATLTKDGQTWKISPEADGYALTILAPEALAGVTYRITDHGARIEAEEMQIPVSEAMTKTPCTLISFFTLTDEALLGVETEKEEGVCARYRTDKGEIRIRFQKDGTPVSFETAEGLWTLCEIEQTSKK